MKALQDLLSTDYGIMSLVVVVITVGLLVFYGVWFTKKMNEDPKDIGK